MWKNAPPDATESRSDRASDTIRFAPLKAVWAYKNVTKMWTSLMFTEFIMGGLLEYRRR